MSIRENKELVVEIALAVAIALIIAPGVIWWVITALEIIR